VTEPSEAPLLLLVEDDPLVSLAIEDFLSSAGFRILAATSGKEAIDHLKADPASISAVVTDIRLGSGPSGWDVAHRVRELVPTMPVVYMTGDSASLWAAHGVPGSVVLQKPFVEAQLITAIATLLNQASTTGTTL